VPRHDTGPPARTSRLVWTTVGALRVGDALAMADADYVVESVRPLPAGWREVRLSGPPRTTSHRRSLLVRRPGTDRLLMVAREAGR
jgi:hypothetical protein